MSKVSIYNKRGKISVCNKVVYPETVNERLNAELAYGKYPDFLPTELVHKSKGANIICTADNLVPLTMFFSETVDKRTFLDIVLKLIGIVKRCEENRINPNNIDFEKDRIFVDPISAAVKCVYWPIVNNQRANPPHIFFSRMPCDVKFTGFEDNAYLRRYAEFFDGYRAFSLNEFEMLIYELMGRAPDAFYGTGGGFSGKLGSEGKTHDFDRPSSDKVEYDPFKSSPVTPGSRHKSGGGKQVQGGSGETTVITNGTTDGTKPIHEEAKQPQCSKLVRTKTGEIIPINKPAITLGCDPMCDYAIRDNGYVSRFHATIINYEMHCCIVDNNSTNKTRVNGMILHPQTETRLIDGMKISLANEEFIYYT